MNTDTRVILWLIWLVFWLMGSQCVFSDWTRSFSWCKKSSWSYLCAIRLLTFNIFAVTGDSKRIKNSLFFLRGLSVLKACLVQRVLFYSSLFVYIFFFAIQVIRLSLINSFHPLRLWFYFHFAGSHHRWPAVWNYLLCHRGSLHHKGGWSSKQGQSHHHNWCRSEAVFSGLSWRKHGALYEYLFTGNTDIISMALNWCPSSFFLREPWGETFCVARVTLSYIVSPVLWLFFFFTITNVESMF